MRGYGTCTLALSVVVGLIGLVGPSSAGAATQIGQTFAPATGCTDIQTQFQTATAGASYAAPIPGVITSWSFLAGSSPAPPQLKLKVARQVSGNDYTIVGESGLVNPAPGVLNTFPTRIPVRVGDVIGFYNNTDLGGRCGELGGGINFVHFKFEDVQPGTTTTFGTSSFRLDVSALVEPDADSDGFGDETQDGCVLDDTAHDAPCPVPETMITKGPKDKTKKKQATFEFSSNLAGGTFECSLDGAAFAPCSSPDSVKVKKGKHHFEVRATAKGQTDATPASDDWKVKRKRK